MNHRQSKSSSLAQSITKTLKVFSSLVFGIFVERSHAKPQSHLIHSVSYLLLVCKMSPVDEGLKM